ncbi:DUF1203 domain-containing protein [Pseudomonas sp. KU26590]|uniref:DUF1203 domain-containing protein n=1 Tax=Pseudomonas sp. KU26590 TaxID=2991051 RepID=UPI00223D7D0A|nr:DUF1203 domain-containing protein [Pseudomonas sp. KU26590]UZJ57769.1 DUF1203 domain-containing protein [Pseudomonas sp. KU26590]
MGRGATEWRRSSKIARASFDEHGDSRGPASLDFLPFQPQESERERTTSTLSIKAQYPSEPTMAFRISGLCPTPFQAFYGLPDNELAALGIKRYIVDAHPGFPDRTEMKDAEVGQRVLLLNHVHQPANTPYRASHAIFVREGATQAYDAVDQIPQSMRIRLLSLRGFSDDGMMIDADVAQGTGLEPVIMQMFANPTVSYIHAHHAKQGCYSGRIDRA